RGARPLPTAGWLLARLTPTPPVGAGPPSVTRPVEELPPVTMLGVSASALGLGASGGVTPMPPWSPPPLIVATSVTAMLCGTALVLIVNGADSAPAGTVTNSGTLTGTGSVRVRSRPGERS